MDTPTIPITSEDVLFDVERRIARRADELVRLSGDNHNQPLIHWLEAEREVWHEVEGQMLAAR